MIRISMNKISLAGATRSFNLDEVAQVLIQYDKSGKRLLIVFLKNGDLVFAPASTPNIEILLNAGVHIFFGELNIEEIAVVEEVDLSEKHHKQNTKKLGI